MKARSKQIGSGLVLVFAVLMGASWLADEAGGGSLENGGGSSLGPDSAGVGGAGLADRLDPEGASASSDRPRGLDRERPRPQGVMRLSPRPIMDRQGFGRPIEAYSILVPEGWSFNAEVVWFGAGICGPGYAQPVLEMESPDGAYAIEVAPGFHIELTSIDLGPAATSSFFGEPYLEQQRQVRQQMERQSREYRASGSHCQVGRAGSARELVERTILPALRPRSRLTRMEPDPAIRAMLEPLVRLGEEVRAMSGYGMYADQVVETMRITLDGVDGAGRPSREILKFGTVGYRMSQVLEGVSPDGFQMIPMGEYAYSADETTWITAYRAPRGELGEFESLAASIIGSLHANPRWQAAFDRFLSNITWIQNQGAMERSRIIAETNDAISDMQMEGWRRRQDSQDRSARAFVNSIRGVVQRIDPSTGFVVDLPDTAYEYYSDGQGNILIIDTPGLDPRELFPLEDWQVMQRP